MDILKKINESIDYIKQKNCPIPDAGIVLGTGLGGLVKAIKNQIKIPYADIPHFPISTIKGHAGNLLFGDLNGKKVVAMQGRFHFYEGYSMQELTFPIRVMKFLGIKLLILSNASGGLNPDFEVGDVMVITDHINLMKENPLRGKNDERLGERFPDMSDVYNKKWTKMARQKADKHKINYQTGVYVGVTGPTFETPAEYKYMRVIGGDAVGMSTVPEAIVAKHMGLPCIAFSVISDLGVEGKIVEISHEDVLKAANSAEPKLSKIVSEVLAEL